MKKLEQIKQTQNVRILHEGYDGCMGFVYLGARKNRMAAFVASWGGGWDHVSVSYQDRCPTWEEMCKAKDMFFMEDECCVEYHPAKSEYVNLHPYCLHIWRPQIGEVITPPRELV